jgi:hypothetical protein
MIFLGLAYQVEAKHFFRRASPRRASPQFSLLLALTRGILAPGQTKPRARQKPTFAVLGWAATRKRSVSAGRLARLPTWKSGDSLRGLLA